MMRDPYRCTWTDEGDAFQIDCTGRLIPKSYAPVCPACNRVVTYRWELEIEHGPGDPTVEEIKRLRARVAELEAGLEEALSEWSRWLSYEEPGVKRGKRGIIPEDIANAVVREQRKRIISLDAHLLPDEPRE